MPRLIYLQSLIPGSDLLFWHSLDNPLAQDGEDVAIIRDDAGAFDLTASANFPLWRNLPTGEQFIELDGAQDPLASNTSGTLRHLFVIASYTDATFPNDADGYKGLVSQVTDANGILAGNPNTNKFFDFGYTSSEYRKSGILYASSNMLAPVSDVPELIEFIVPGGIALSSLQIGQDRDFTARKWSGRIFSVIGYSQVKTGIELEKIRLYADLRARLWIALNKQLLFPRNILVRGVTPYSRFKPIRLDFEAVTKSHTYDDENKTFNQLNDLPPRRFEVGFNNLTAEQAQILDAFWNNVRKIKTFNFYDYKSGKTWSNVRVNDYDYDFEAHKSFKNNCTFNLVQFKFGYVDTVIDDAPPTVSLISAVLSTVLDINGISGDNSDFVTLQLYMNDAPYGSPTDVGTGAFTFPVFLGDLLTGANTFYVVATDISGNTATSNTISYTAVPDTFDPSVPVIFSISGTLTSEMLVEWYPSSDEEAFGSDGDDYLGI